jgi:hypothetical protein
VRKKSGSIWAAVLLAIWLSTQGANAGPIKVINLRPLGYPSQSCDYKFHGYGLHPEQHLEFLDSEHLIVKFPIRKEGQCQTGGYSWPADFRSAVLETSGALVSSLDWSRPSISDIQAGPDGKILEIVSGEIKTLDQDFHPLQEVDLPAANWPKYPSPSLWSVQLAPSRHGFAATYPEFIGRGFNGFSAYFEDSSPIRQTVALDTDHIILGDGIMVSSAGPQGVIAATRSVQLATGTYTCAKSFWIAIPLPNLPICLTSDYQLVALTSGGGMKLIADVRNMAPGLWNSGFRYQLTNEKAGILLLDSIGVRFPVTDSWGFGDYRIVAAYELNTGRQVFRGQVPFDADVAISPDGNLLATLVKTKISIYRLH